jgi:hypothetical protein
MVLLGVGAWLGNKTLKTEKGRYAFDAFVLRVPLVAHCQRRKCGTFCQYLKYFKP